MTEQEKMSRQVRRALERAGKPPEDAREDTHIAEMSAKFKAERAQKAERDAAATSLGKRNIYTCTECFGHVVTADLAEGVTPFMIDCKATDGCKGMMQSSFYRVFDQRMRADFEWFKPSKEELVAMSAGVREHIRKGGLALRPAKVS